MRSSAKSRAIAAVSGLFRGMRIALCLVVFSATAAAVWWAGPPTVEAPASYTASATVVRTQPASSLSAGAAGAGRADRDELIRRVTSEAGLRRALAKLPSPAGPAATIDALRRHLSVAASETAVPGESEIHLSYVGSDPGRVVDLINVLARQVAEEERAAFTASTVQAWHQARQNTEQARRKLSVARTNLESFLAAHFEEHRQLAEAIESAGRQWSPMPQAAGSAAAARKIDNSEWVDLDRSRRELLRLRDELLVTRMPQHPTVVELDSKIAELEESLARVPREIPDEADPPVIAHPMIGAPPMQPPTEAAALEEPSAALGRVLPAQGGLGHGLSAQKYFELAAAVEAAKQSHERLAEAEQQAAERCLAAPGIELHLAQQPEATELCDKGSAQLLLVALAAGLAFAAGAGMLATGLAAEPPLETVAQAQAALPVPIVGLVPLEDDGSGEAVPRQFPDRALALWGMVLMAVCGLGLLVYFS